MTQEMDRKVRIMGIVNITDNSYYAASRHLDSEGRVELDAVRRDIRIMLEEGADIIDLGACSTRPGAAAVGADEEWRRLEPVMHLIATEFEGLKISVDTYWSSVIEHCYEALKESSNKLIVNDISAGERDPRILEVSGRLGLTFVAMHSVGETASKVDYPDGVVAAVERYFEDFAIKAEEAGIKDWILDPGFGFSKTVEENWELLRNMSRLRRQYGSTTPEILVGISRKSMIYKPLGITPEEALSATCEAHRLAIAQGADILRVHDVAPAVDLLR